MMLVHPEIAYEFRFTNSKINTLVIENRRLFTLFLEDLYLQINGFDGKAVLSEDFVPIAMSKRLELIYDFIGLELNRKQLLNRAISEIERTVLDEQHLTALELLSRIQSLIEECSLNSKCNIIANKVSVNSLLKSAGIMFADDYSGAGGYAEKLIDYMELVREFECEKLFVTVNMRSFFDDQIIEAFCDTVIHNEFKILMIENHEYSMLKHEQRFIIDSDLCEIIKPIDSRKFL